MLKRRGEEKGMSEVKAVWDVGLDEEGGQGGVVFRTGGINTGAEFKIMDLIALLRAFKQGVWRRILDRSRTTLLAVSGIVIDNSRTWLITFRDRSPFAGLYTLKHFQIYGRQLEFSMRSLIVSPFASSFHGMPCPVLGVQLSPGTFRSSVHTCTVGPHSSVYVSFSIPSKQQCSFAPVHIRRFGMSRESTFTQTIFGSLNRDPEVSFADAVGNPGRWPQLTQSSGFSVLSTFK